MNGSKRKRVEVAEDIFPALRSSAIVKVSRQNC